MFTKNEATIKICTENLKSKTKYHNSDALYTKAILKCFIIMLPSKTPNFDQIHDYIKGNPRMHCDKLIKKIWKVADESIKIA